MRKDWEEKTSPEYYSNGKDDAINQDRPVCDLLSYQLTAKGH